MVRGALVIGLALAVISVSAPRAWAHGLEADYRVLPDGRVQIESWYGPGGESLHGARVEVFREDGTRVTEGQTDGRGVFTFKPAGPGPLRVVISAGAGHRKELTIAARDAASASRGTAATSAAEDQPPLFADRGARTSVKDVLLGVCLVLAAAAFALSWRNTRRLRALARQRPPGDH